MRTVLVTGANRGLGLEFARQYAAEGWRVIAGCRRPEEAADLAALPGAVTVETLDVGDEGSIAVLKAHIANEPIDLLVNNAGVYGGRTVQVLGSLEADEWMRVLRVNVAGPLLMAQALADNLAAGARRAGRPAVVAAVSSKMGSIAENTSGGSYAYRSSKAALNAAMRSYALDMERDGVLAVVLHPGWVRTAMGGPNGLIDAPESVTGMRAVIAGLTPDKSGRFFDYTGAEIPW
ncbi:SDR family oxidoreductase [Novispirillum sp. DQ9]|uniref:SDR family oxidoreductase n=1 Tax=Novispirillum sp. DQ9 TaxID=3398612 RepID=UPI003C7B3604